MVTLVNPGNPTGVMIPRATIEAFSELCAEFGVWLVLDNTYEHFSYAGEAEHSCLEAPHIIYPNPNPNHNPNQAHIINPNPNPNPNPNQAPHIINVFSFSKAYGMMGWRA